MGKYQFLSNSQKRQQAVEKAEEAAILAAKYAPNERTVFRRGIFTLKYAEVREGELMYLACHDRTGNYYFLPERLLLSDQN